MRCKRFTFKFEVVDLICTSWRCKGIEGEIWCDLLFNYCTLKKYNAKVISGPQEEPWGTMGDLISTLMETLVKPWENPPGELGWVTAPQGFIL